MLEDEDGRRWKTVRDAFWQGELGFCDVHYAREQHELMLRVLASIDQRRPARAESKYDLFNGDMAVWRFYLNWLASIGMLGDRAGLGKATNPLEAVLSPEGRSVLMMLRATREPAWEELPMPSVIEAVIATERDANEQTREHALRAFEAAVGFRRHVFARERAGSSYVVTLTGLDGGPGVSMPVRRVNWSTAFVDSVARDDLFAWLAKRVDRWDDWGSMAYSKGGETLTRHLLSLMVVNRRDD